VAILKRTPNGPPQIAILNGELHCIFIQNTAEKILLWFARPLLSFHLYSWMCYHRDHTPISSLTIPGTHDYSFAQPLTLFQQLTLGIRFFDLRLQLDADGLFYAFRSSTGCLLYSPFSEMMRSVVNFLEVQQSETVLISITQDASQSWISPSRFCSAVRTEIDAMAANSRGRPRWYTLSDIPDLGTVRSRVVLLRRFPLPNHVLGSPPPPLGIDFSNWEESKPASSSNQTDPSHTDKVFVLSKFLIPMGMSLATLVQIHSRKVVDHMLRSCRREAGTWSVALCSAQCHPAECIGKPFGAVHVAGGAHSKLSNKWVDGMNVVLARFLRNMSTSRWDERLGWKTGLGIVLMDFPGEAESGDAVATLLEMALPHCHRRSPGPNGVGLPGAGGFGLFETYRDAVGSKAEVESVGTPTGANREADDTETDEESVSPPAGTKRKVEDISKTPPVEDADTFASP
jgi:hypothetical protein